MLRLRLNYDEMCMIADKAMSYFATTPPKSVNELALFISMKALAERLTLKATKLSFSAKTEALMSFEITEILALRSLSYANVSPYFLASLISIHDIIDRWCNSELKKIQSQYQSRN